MSDMPAPPALPRRRGMRRAAVEGGVIKTNDDAQATKLSCVSMGYFQDAVLPLLHKSLPIRKPPIINRGTWARHAVFRQITHDFVKACTQHAAASSTTTTSQPPAAAAGTAAGTDSSTGSASAGSSRWDQPICQVVAMGAGTDSSWFNLRHQAWGLLPAAHFIEMDFQEVVSKKARTVLSTPQLLKLLPDGTIAATAPLAASTQQTAAAAATCVMPPPMQPSPTATTAAAAAAGVAAGAGGDLISSSKHSSHSQGALTWIKQAQQPCNTTPAPAPAAVQDAQAVQQCSTDDASMHSQQQQQQQPAGSGGVRPVCQAHAVPASSSTVQQQQQLGSNTGSTHHSELQPPAAVVQHVHELTGPQYSLVAADLRDIQQLRAALARAGFKPGLPTLFLCECVLIYLEASEAAAVLATAAAMAAEAGAPAAVAIYEQTRPDDAFGSTMISNLEARGCPLRSVTSVPTPDSQAQRLQACGWTAAAAADMAAVYYAGRSNSSSSTLGRHQGGPAAAAAAGGSGGGWLRLSWQAERRRIEGLELLDELEEWRLLQGHYCLALGVLGDGGSQWLSDALQLQQLAMLTA